MTFINNNPALKRQWGVLFAILFLVGIFFRFGYLDKRIYWHDEAHTSLRASGHMGGDVLEEFFGTPEFSAQDLMKFQQLDTEKDTVDALQVMAISAPHHPPLYYLLSRLWMHWFGGAPATMRSLAALLSLLIFPCLYWASMEIFGSRRTTLIALALLSISPIHVVFAREAREYSLWAVTTLASCAALLRALRLKTKLDWALYCFTLTLGLYSHLFHLFVATAHGFYILVISIRQSGIQILANRNLRAYTLASLMALTAYGPWIWVVINYLPTIRRTTQWLETPVPIGMLIKMWAARYSGLFVDFEPLPFYLQGSFILAVIILIGYAFLYLWKNGPEDSSILIFLLICMNAGLLVAADLIAGGWRSGIPRYQIPTFLSLQLTVSFLLSKQLSTIKSLKNLFWQFVIIGLLLLGAFSNLLFVQADSWWDKGFDYGRPEMIRTVNQADNPVLIFDTRTGNALGDLLSLGHELEPHVRIKWSDDALDSLDRKFSDVFVYRLSDDSKRTISETDNQKLIPIVPGLLWQLVDDKT